MNPHLRDVAIPNDWDRRGLPGWSYHSDALLELEKEHVFRNHWQIVGHVSDLPDAGDYLTMDVVGERALIVRSMDDSATTQLNITTGGKTYSFDLVTDRDAFHSVTF